jgi:glycosyltransferase involved in cell wall biosynthesis
LHVLLITQYFPPDLGGVATRTSNLAKGLSLNGCKVTVITAFPHYPHGKIPEQYHYVPLKIEQMGQLKVIRTLVPPIKSQGFFKRLLLMASFVVSSLFAVPLVGQTDVVLGSSWVPGLIYSRLKRVPVVLDVCDLTVEDLPMLKMADQDSIILKIATVIYRFFYVKADAVIPISPGYVETIEKKYYVNKDQINVVEVGVDLSTFELDNANSNTSGKSFKVYYAGVLGVGYDFEQIFQAAKLLEAKSINVTFVLHGSGECLDSIKNRIKELNLVSVKVSDKILDSRKEVASFLNEADALILPLKDYGAPYPGIPSKLYEYQAVGKPIICCADGEPANYIKETKSGVIVPPGRPDALVKSILFLCQNKTAAVTFGIAGRKYVEENLGLNKLGFKLKLVLDKIRSS